jgi:hypothetical protein
MKMTAKLWGKTYLHTPYSIDVSVAALKIQYGSYHLKIKKQKYAK